jgi:hypothetical protein
VTNMALIQDAFKANEARQPLVKSRTPIEMR